MDTVEHIIDTLNHIESVKNEGDLKQLEQALHALAYVPYPERALDALFHVYERFPESDGYGLFWTMVHRIESIPGFERSLVASVQRHPMAFNLHMVNALLNAGSTYTAGVDLHAVLAHVATNPEYADTVRQQARQFIEQRNE